mgnify:CR=1 FL=1
MCIAAALPTTLLVQPIAIGVAIKSGWSQFATTKGPMAASSIVTYTVSLKPGGSLRTTAENSLQLAARCTVEVGQPVTSYEGLEFDTRPPASQKVGWPSVAYRARKFDLNGLGKHGHPIFVCAFAPDSNESPRTYQGLVASPLESPVHSLYCPNFSLLSVLIVGVLIAKVANLSQDAVYGGNVIAVLDPAPGNPFYLTYDFDGGDAHNRPRVGYLLEVVDRTHARIFAVRPPA